MIGKIRDIKWKKGASTGIIYIGTLWLMMIGILFFMESFNVFAKVGKTQLYADLLSDGICFIGDNGWGISKKNADLAKTRLVNKNKEYFKNISVPSSGTDNTSLKYYDIILTDEKGRPTNDAKYKDRGNSAKNTVHVTAKTDAMTLTTNQKINAERTAETKITYSGGMRIVREAWMKSYQYKHSTSNQTPYVWGGGHGDMSLSCLDSGADCSGFVTAIFRKCGYAEIVGNGCTWDLEKCGKTVGDGRTYASLEYARPGDIILYWWTGGADLCSSHVAIYAGKHKGVHYQIHSKGNSSVTSPMKGNMTYGVNLTPVSNSASRIKIQRIVTSDAKADEFRTDYTLPNLTRNEMIINDALNGAGYTPISSRQGIMGNWSWEGNCEPTVRQNHSDPNDSFNKHYADGIRKGVISKSAFINQKQEDGSSPEGYGIAQWTTTSTNAEADRKAKLWDHAEGMGLDVTSLYAQLSYAIYEMKNVYGLTTRWLNTMTTDEVTAIFFQYFEAGGVYDTDGTLKNRQARARSMLLPQ